MGRVAPGSPGLCERCGAEVYVLQVARHWAGRGGRLQPLMLERRPAAGLRTRDLTICALYPFHPEDCLTRAH